MMFTSLVGAFVAASICFVLVVLLVPSVFNSQFFRDGLIIFLKKGKFGQALSFTLFSIVIPVNRVLMSIEDVIIPGLDEISEEYFTKRNKLVFITGHPRSGTTNVHKAVSSLKGVTTGTQFDLPACSIILKYLFTPIISVINFVFFKNLVNQDDITGHKFGVYEELEEQHLFCYYHAGEVPGCYLFPTLGTDAKFMENTTKLQDIHLEFIKRHIVRTLYFRGRTTKAYVGCPLGFTMDPVLFRKHFPLAKVVVCCRDPVQSVPSLLDLTATVISDKKLDGTHTEHYKMLYNLYTLSVYKNMASWAGDDETIWLDFENWKNDGVKQLEMIWSELKWEAPP